MSGIGDYVCIKEAGTEWVRTSLSSFMTSFSDTFYIASANF